MLTCKNTDCVKGKTGDNFIYYKDLALLVGGMVFMVFRG
jgi:hypothetical protein